MLALTFSAVYFMSVIVCSACRISSQDGRHEDDVRGRTGGTSRTGTWCLCKYSFKCQHPRFILGFAGFCGYFSWNFGNLCIFLYGPLTEWIYSGFSLVLWLIQSEYMLSHSHSLYISLSISLSLSLSLYIYLSIYISLSLSLSHSLSLTKLCIVFLFVKTTSLRDFILGSPSFGVNPVGTLYKLCTPL